jgi:dTDP-glucose 4,6-dehydratase
LGALISIPYSYVHPTEVSEVNVMGTVNVLNAALVTGAERVVHTSTSETYGTAVSVPIAESHPLQAQSPYSASKIGADAAVHAYWSAFGLPVSTIRPFNIYGPRQSGRAVVPTIIGQALSLARVTLGSLSPTRDFTYVTDTVRCFLDVAESDQAIGRVVNVGSGKEISIGDLAARILDRLGIDVPVVTSPERIRPESSELFRLVCDSSLARELVGWEPTVSLDDGIDRVVGFLRTHPNWTTVDRYEV